MKLTVVCTFVGVLALFVCDLNAQLGGPAFGWAIGQQASVSAVSLAIDGALAKSDSSTLPPESQEELEQILADAKLGLAACDDLLTSSTVWRYKICKFQELAKFKGRLTELKLKAAAAAASSTTEARPVAQSDDGSANAAQSP